MFPVYFCRETFILVSVAMGVITPPVLYPDLMPKYETTQTTYGRDHVCPNLPRTYMIPYHIRTL